MKFSLMVFLLVGSIWHGYVIPCQIEPCYDPNSSYAHYENPPTPVKKRYVQESWRNPLYLQPIPKKETLFESANKTIEEVKKRRNSALIMENRKLKNYIKKMEEIENQRITVTPAAG